MNFSKCYFLWKAHYLIKLFLLIWSKRRKQPSLRISYFKHPINYSFLIQSKLKHSFESFTFLVLYSLPDFKDRLHNSISIFQFWYFLVLHRGRSAYPQRRNFLKDYTITLQKKKKIANNIIKRTLEILEHLDLLRASCISSHKSFLLKEAALKLDDQQSYLIGIWWILMCKILIILSTVLLSAISVTHGQSQTRSRWSSWCTIRRLIVA